MTLTYTGPERRKQGLYECFDCRRLLRPQYFRRDSTANDGVAGYCHSCESVRDWQEATELRAAYDRAHPPMAASVKTIERDERGLITRIVETRPLEGRSA
jgi:hypothetical protein